MSVIDGPGRIWKKVSVSGQPTKEAEDSFLDWSDELREIGSVARRETPNFSDSILVDFDSSGNGVLWSNGGTSALICQTEFAATGSVLACDAADRTANAPLDQRKRRIILPPTTRAGDWHQGLQHARNLSRHRCPRHQQPAEYSDASCAGTRRARWCSAAPDPRSPVRSRGCRSPVRRAGR